MNVTLSYACSIFTGYTARGRLESTATGGVPVIQLRDLSLPEGLKPDSLMRVNVESAVARYLVRPGDVVFRSRGDRNTAVVIDKRFNEPAVAVLPLMILRPKSGFITPEYLAWAINQPQAQRQFDSAARGTSLRMVPRSSLEKLEIHVPDVDTQRKIVAVDALSQRELTLSFLASEKRKELTSRILSDRAKNLIHIAGDERKAE